MNTMRTYILHAFFLFLSFTMASCAAIDWVDPYYKEVAGITDPVTTAPTSQYTITFDANSGTGTMSNLTVTEGASINLTTNTYTMAGHAFLGWSTSSGATTADYADGASHSMGNANVTLYAVWAVEYTITFDANGGTGTMNPITANSGQTVTLTTNAYSKTGYLLLGWATSSGAATATYADGASHSMGNSNVTLYAVWAQIAAWSARIGYQVVVFNNELYLLGGNTGSDTQSNTDKNDVWKSADGINWTEVTSGAGWSARNGHQVVVFNNELYLLGGNHGSSTSANNKNDVYKSADGINWIEVTSGAGWSARNGHQVVVFNNELYLLGGTDASLWQGGIHHNNDVWTSSDGINWTEVTSSTPAPWSARYGHQVVVFNNLLYLLGGNNGSSSAPLNKNDVWIAADGINWTEVTSSAGWSARYGHQVVVFNNDLYLLGGTNATYSQSTHENDVWKSADGSSWTQ